MLRPPLLAVALAVLAAPAVPADEPYLGVLFVGQSNMVGGNVGPRSSAPGGLDSLPERVFCLDRSNEITPWHQPFPFRLLFDGEPGTSANVSPAVAFVQRLAERYPEHRICVVFCAKTAAGYNDNLPDPERSWAADGSALEIPSNLYDYTVRRVRDAIEQNVRFVAVAHYLGEADAGHLSQAQFATEVTLLIAGLRGAVGPVPVALGGMPQWPNTPYGDVSEVEAALMEVAAADPMTSFAPATGLTPTPDLAHFDTPSTRELGRRMFDVLDADGLFPPLPSPPYEPPVQEPVGPLPPLPSAVVLRQDFTPGVWFESYSDALAGGSPDDRMYSALARFEDFRRPTGEFRLEARWGTGEWIAWSQTSNPFRTPLDVVEGLTVLDDPLGLVPSGLFHGLCRTSVTGALLAFRRGQTTLAAPTAGLYLYNEYLIAQSVGFANVVVSPAGLPTSWLELVAR